MPVKNAAAGIVRSPPGPRATSSASSVSRIVPRSEAGSPWATEPPIVPRWRTCGSPISAAVCGISAQPCGEHRVADEVGVPRERADRDPVAVVAHVAEVGEAADVDEQRRPREAEPQQRDQRVAAGEELRVLVAAEQLERLVDRAGAAVLERAGDHAPALAAACTAATMLW